MIWLFHTSMAFLHAVGLKTFLGKVTDNTVNIVAIQLLLCPV